MYNDFNDIIANLDNNVNKLIIKSKKIKEKFNQNNLVINEENLEIFLKISKNLNLLNDQYEELYILSLKTNLNTNNLTSEEKYIIRNDKINNIVNKKFLPYILFLQICLQNIDLENY